MAKKIRSHNEYFRKVNVKTVYGEKYREPSLIEEIMQREHNANLSQEERDQLRHDLEQPYKTIIGFVSSRKSCPCCKAKLEPGEFVWSWGEYVRAKWNTVTHFCKNCFEKEVRQRLVGHADDCGCHIELVCRDGQPVWLTLEKETCNVAD